MGKIKNQRVVFTIGHSTQSLENFVSIIKGLSIGWVVDIRTIPRSRHNPQFNKETLPSSLQLLGINYSHMQGLGGLRRAKADSINKGWRNATFRGYADYMQTEEFAKNLQVLTTLATKVPVVIMCAEVLPWRCHRWLVADALTLRGFEATHIMGKNQLRKHALTPFAKVEGTKITYPQPVDNEMPLHSSIMTKTEQTNLRKASSLDAGA